MLRRSLAMFALAGSLMLAPGGALAAVPYDVNGDGQVTTLDAFCVFGRLDGGAPTENCPATSHLDSNGDGEITSADALCVLRFVVGMPANALCPAEPLDTGL